MKKLLIILLLFVSVQGFSQWTRSLGGYYRPGIHVNGIKLDSIAVLPTDTTRNKLTGSIAVKNNAALFKDATGWRELLKSSVISSYLLKADSTANSGYATQYDISSKVDKEPGKTLSSNDFTDADSIRLEVLKDSSEINVKYKIIGSYQKDFFVAGQNARVLTPSTYSYKGSPSKLCIYFHYYGGNYTTEPPLAFRDSLLNAGYAIATMSTGNLWGNDLQQKYYISLYDEVQKYFNVEKTFIATSWSMGGLPIMNLIDRNILPISKAVIIDGVASLKGYYNQGVAGGDPRNTIQAAYNFTDSLDLEKAIFGFDPYTRIKNYYGDSIYHINTPVYWLHGTDDTSAKFNITRSIYNAAVKLNKNVVLDSIIGGTHDTTIVTASVVHNVINWINNTTIIDRPPVTVNPVIKFRNNIKIYDRSSDFYLSNYIDFLDLSGSRRGMVGFFNSGIIGNNANGITNEQGNIGIFTQNNKSLFIGRLTTDINTPDFKFSNGKLLIKKSMNIADSTIYPFEVIDTSAVNAKFGGRVIGGNAVNSNEFMTLGQIPMSGTSGYIPIFTAAKSIGNSTISQSGTSTTLSGSEHTTLNITGGDTYSPTIYLNSVEHPYSAYISSYCTTDDNAFMSLNVGHTPVAYLRKNYLAFGYAYGDLGGLTSKYNFNGTLNTTGAMTASNYISNIATGTAPFTVASTTKVSNLNVDQVDGLDLASGVYSPTFTNTTNITSSSASSNCTYSRVGNIVTVTVSGSITPTASGLCTLCITVPITQSSVSTFGTAVFYNNDGYLPGYVTTHLVSDCALFFNAVSSTIGSFTATFQYSL